MVKVSLVVGKHRHSMVVSEATSTEHIGIYVSV